MSAHKMYYLKLSWSEIRFNMLMLIEGLYQLEFLGNGHDSNLEDVNTSHEGESKEEAEGAPKLCEEGGPGVEEVLLLHQDGGGGVPQHQAPTVTPCSL